MDSKGASSVNELNNDENSLILKSFFTTTVNTITNPKHGEKNINPENIVFYSIKDIIKILRENNISENIIKHIDINSITNEDMQNLIPRESLKFITKIKRDKNNETEKHIGRKRKGDNTKAEHDKYKPDNIIRKIKVNIFRNLIGFINSYISNISNEEQLVGLDYQYISELKKNKNLKMLETPLEELLSYENSSKYGPENKNREIISEIKNTKDDKIKRLLIMEFSEWLNIFLFKQKTEDEIKFNGLQLTLKNLIKNEPKDYFSKFILYLYNYQNYFENKKGRKEKMIQ